MAVEGAKPDDEDGEEGPEIGFEAADIEALARSQLLPGENILTDDRSSEQALEKRNRGIFLKPALLQKLQDIEYKVPTGAKRVPWIDTLTITGGQGLPKNLKAKDGVKLESAFMNMAKDAVREAYSRLRVMKVPCSRPSDFYAEMLRSDKTMYRVRARASEEQRRMRIVESRKQALAAKRFSKNAKSQKQKARAKEKKDTLEEVKDWQKQKKGEKNVDDQKDLNEILDRAKRDGKLDAGKGAGKGKGKGRHKKSSKREAADAKYGFGGKNKKRNTHASVDDFSASPWGKGEDKGKGKGKGKGVRKKGKR
mmetsp:Transcript_63367/g.147624  ORF Transcript_63367/g.147624 Transcript_63367/m.147624 type:complete len:309 (-) Transcript_63367:49-975(-)